MDSSRDTLLRKLDLNIAAVQKELRSAQRAHRAMASASERTWLVACTLVALTHPDTDVACHWLRAKRKDTSLLEPSATEHLLQWHARQVKKRHCEKHFGAHRAQEDQHLERRQEVFG